MNENPKSVYLLGAEDGVVMGPLMTLAMVLSGASAYLPWLAIPGLLCIFAVPVAAYMRLAISHRNAPHAMTFSALWLQGICMFFFGGLVMAAVVFVLLRWGAPDFVLRQFDAAIKIYSSMDNATAAEMADVFRKAKEAGLVPSALDVALQLLFFAVFSGSILSIIYALIIRRKNF